MIDLAVHRPLGTWRRLFYTGPSTDVLYEDYARRGRIDELAPISARCETIIDAPIERVWELLSHPQRWEQFASEVRDVRLDDGVVEGGRFTWRNGKTKLSSRFAVVDPGHELTWIGTALGSKAVHRHLLAPTNDDRTRLISEESMAGPLLVLFFSSAKLRPRSPRGSPPSAPPPNAERTSDSQPPRPRRTGQLACSDRNAWSSSSNSSCCSSCGLWPLSSKTTSRPVGTASMASSHSSTGHR